MPADHLGILSSFKHEFWMGVRMNLEAGYAGADGGIGMNDGYAQLATCVVDPQSVRDLRLLGAPPVTTIRGMPAR